MAFFIARKAQRLSERLSRRTRVVIGVVWVVVFGFGGIALGAWMLNAFDAGEASPRGVPWGVVGVGMLVVGGVAACIGIVQTIRIARGRA